jgi:hypothetical protein
MAEADGVAVSSVLVSDEVRARVIGRGGLGGLLRIKNRSGTCLDAPCLTFESWVCVPP